MLKYIFQTTINCYIMVKNSYYCLRMNDVKIKRKRHVVKAITWRCVGTLDTWLISWLLISNSNEISFLNTDLDITSRAAEAASYIAIFELISKTILYYFHERVWSNANWVLGTTKSKMDQKRHIFKTFSWRAIGTLDTLLLSWIFTGSPLTGVKIALAEILTKMLLYYFHERIWFKSNWGVSKPLKD